MKKKKTRVVKQNTNLRLKSNRDNIAFVAEIVRSEQENVHQHNVSDTTGKCDSPQKFPRKTTIKSDCSKRSPKPKQTESQHPIPATGSRSSGARLQQPDLNSSKESVCSPKKRSKLDKLYLDNHSESDEECEMEERRTQNCNIPGIKRSCRVRQRKKRQICSCTPCIANQNSEFNRNSKITKTLIRCSSVESFSKSALVRLQDFDSTDISTEAKPTTKSVNKNITVKSDKLRQRYLNSDYPSDIKETAVMNLEANQQFEGIFAGKSKLNTVNSRRSAITNSICDSDLLREMKTANVVGKHPPINNSSVTNNAKVVTRIESKLIESSDTDFTSLDDVNGEYFVSRSKLPMSKTIRTIIRDTTKKKNRMQSILTPLSNRVSPATNSFTDSSTDDMANVGDYSSKGCVNCKILSKKILSLTKRLTKITTAYRDLRIKSNRLACALTSRLLPSEDNFNFKTVPGYPSADKLTQLSNHAGDSDFIFIKLVMKELWPQGFHGRTVTGRASNNPSGRPIDVSNANSSVHMPLANDSSGKEPLEKEKVNYVKERLYERKILTGMDPTTAAQESARQSGRHMARVIAYYAKMGHF
ncbi:uncharacterized protein LOC131440612 [Malaya genurostris]|uniref:uncharacterized protein LOC131427389 n=1 Tax=Malaya genurostris TaxID=325434 RepID=UPI0026F3930D|nr:uncharacterized protein LOC131427389 [Malaya genurostris]XP_058446527.1 uncharacterized protein LOC131427390 [Malaya genurostris]XP_058465285.1 uncharacterized protein LOC131438886 [Malaya genurostris]XP_058468031.1 uncharacterized protein LOC131440612 [Malaya genurostris]